jgi:hypothetical protein
LGRRRERKVSGPNDRLANSVTDITGSEGQRQCAFISRERWQVRFIIPPKVTAPAFRANCVIGR